MYTQLCGRGMCAQRGAQHGTAAHGVVSRREMGGTCACARGGGGAAGLSMRETHRPQTAWTGPWARAEGGLRLASTHGAPSLGSWWRLPNGKQRGLGAAGRAGYFFLFQRRRGSFDGRGCAAPAAVAGQAAPWKTAAPGRMAAAAAQDHLKRILRKALRKSRLKMV